MDRKKIEKIMKAEGLSDWKLKITNSGSCCWCDNKQIWIDERQLNISMVLHEIAHALLSGREDRTHNYVFADKYTELVEKYCQLKLDEKEIEKILKNNAIRVDLNAGMTSIFADRFKDITKEICKL